MSKDLENNKEYLELEEEIFFNNIDEYENVDIEKIKNDVYSKIGVYENNSVNNNKKRKYKWVQVATIFLTLVVGIPVAKAVVDNLYNYIPQEGIVIETENTLYSLEKQEVVYRDGNKMIVESLIIDQNDKKITTKISGSGDIPIESASISIGETIIDTQSYSLGSGGDTWQLSHFFTGEFSISEGEEVLYTLYFEDESKIDIKCSIEKVKSVQGYSNLGPTDTKEGITITAVANEEGNILDVNFISKLESNNGNVEEYHNEYSKKDKGVVLKDTNGRVVHGEKVHHGDRANHYQFNTKGLEKTYTIEVEEVLLSTYGTINEKKINIDLPKEGKIEINKDITLEGPNENFNSKNNTIRIKSIEENTENNIMEETNYKIDIEFPQNKNNNIKIQNIGINPYVKYFKSSVDFTGWGTDYSEEDFILKSLYIPIEKKHKDNLEFNINPSKYLITGNWNLIIK